MLEDKNKLDQIGNELQRSTGYTFTAGHRASAMRIIWKQAQAMNREREKNERGKYFQSKQSFYFYKKKKLSCNTFNSWINQIVKLVLKII